MQGKDTTDATLQEIKLFNCCCQRTGEGRRDFSKCVRLQPGHVRREEEIRCSQNFFCWWQARSQSNRDDGMLIPGPRRPYSVITRGNWASPRPALLGGPSYCNLRGRVGHPVSEARGRQSSAEARDQRAMTGRPERGTETAATGGVDINMFGHLRRQRANSESTLPCPESSSPSP